MDGYVKILKVIRNVGAFLDELVNDWVYQFFYSFANDPILFNDIKKLKEINELHIDVFRNNGFRTPYQKVFDIRYF